MISMEYFSFDIAETARVMRRAFDRRAATLGVTRAQWRVLVWLSRFDGARQVEMAEGLDVEPITLCRMVDRLEEAGLVERRRDEGDRRAWNVFLCPKAGPLIAELQALGEAFNDEMLAGIVPAERNRARAVLARIRDNLNRNTLSKGGEAARKAS